MEINELLPIGSVISLKEGKKKLMIFGVKQKNEDDQKDYDYVGVLYPEGNIGKGAQFMFNHENVQDVHHRGFEDEERNTFIAKLDDFYSKKETEN